MPGATDTPAVLSTIRSMVLCVLASICVSLFAAGPHAGSGGGSAPGPVGASKEAVELVLAFGHARDMKGRMQSPELRSANPAFARIAAMPEAELVQVIAGVFDTLASARELSDVSKLLKTPGGRLLAKDYDRIVKEFGGDVPVYALSLPSSQVAVHEAGRMPGWAAVRRIGNDARYFEQVLRRVMAADAPPQRRPAAGAGATT